MKWLAGTFGAFVLVLAAVAFGGILGGGTRVPTLPASAEATTEIPPVALAAYQAAAPLCPGLPWAILAGIGKEETGHGTANGHHLDDTGQEVPANPPLHSNVNNGALGYAYGPMQFLAGTWAAYGPKVAPGLNNSDMATGPVQNVNYATKGAALLLCAAAGGQITDEASLRKAIDSYSGSTDGYADDVLTLAQLYAAGGSTPAGQAHTPPPNSSASGLRIVYAAIKEVGIPYGSGEPAKGDPGVGFQFTGHPPGPWIIGHFQARDPRYFQIDCSGLVNVAMKIAFDLDLNFCSSNYLTDSRFVSVPMNQLQPGDLVIWGGCPHGHIAIVAWADNTAGLASTIEASRHGTVVGFKAKQATATWSFTAARRYRG